MKIKKIRYSLIDISNRNDDGKISLTVPFYISMVGFTVIRSNLIRSRNSSVFGNYYKELLLVHLG